MLRQNIEIYWINNKYMAADILTKLNSDSKPFFDLMESGKYQIKVCKESGVKRKPATSEPNRSVKVNSREKQPFA